MKLYLMEDWSNTPFRIIGTSPRLGVRVPNQLESAEAALSVASLTGGVALLKPDGCCGVRRPCVVHGQHAETAKEWPLNEEGLRNPAKNFQEGVKKVEGFKVSLPPVIEVKDDFVMGTLTSETMSPGSYYIVAEEGDFTGEVSRTDPGNYEIISGSVRVRETGFEFPLEANSNPCSNQGDPEIPDGRTFAVYGMEKSFIHSAV